ncbi:MAG: PQQ-binding-like beta-propeller repeat protein [Chloroflexi bacterium]|nr:PQQ-binding-like beta-propeller repeat protein [Chloroflexota bacterium]
MNAKRFTLLFLALAGILLLSACTTSSATGSNWPGLAADAQTAYLSDGAMIYAVRLRDGAELWRYPEKADSKKSFYATPVLLADGRMVIGSAGTDHCLYVIDTTQVAADTNTPDSTCIFAGSKDRWIASPLVVENTVYAPNNDGTLYVVDLTSGELLWSLEIGQGGHLWSTPTTDGAMLYLSSLDHNVYAINIESRKVAWTADLSGSVVSTPALSADGKTLYVGSLASKVFALNAADGSILWEAKTQKWVWGAPLVDGDAVYAADLDGQLYALDAATGKIAWNSKPADAITGSPLLMGDQIIVTTESGGVYTYDRQGKRGWDAAIQGKLYTTPVQAGDLLLVAPLSNGAEFYMTALDLDGTVRWPFKPE